MVSMLTYHRISNETKHTLIKINFFNSTSYSNLTLTPHTSPSPNVHIHTLTHRHTKSSHCHHPTHSSLNCKAIHPHLCTVLKHPFQLVLLICLGQVCKISLVVQNHLPSKKQKLNTSYNNSIHPQDTACVYTLQCYC